MPGAPQQPASQPSPQPTLESAGTGPTGHPGVDAALTLLDDLDELGVEDHAERLTAVHEQLHAALDEHRTAQD